MLQVHSFTCSCPVFPAPLIEETVFSPLDSLCLRLIYCMLVSSFMGSLFCFMEKAMAPPSSTLAWKIPWTEEPGRLQSMVLQRVGHNWTTSFTFHFPALEKEMATHSSVLAWRIPGMVEPGGLPSLGSHRVGHDWSDLATAAAQKIQTPIWVFMRVFISEIWSEDWWVCNFLLIGGWWGNRVVFRESWAHPPGWGP